MALQRTMLGGLLLLVACALGAYAALSGVTARAIRDFPSLKVAVGSSGRAPTPSLAITGAAAVSAGNPSSSASDRPEPGAPTGKQVGSDALDAAFAARGVVPQADVAVEGSALVADVRLEAPRMIERLKTMVPANLKIEPEINASLYAVSYQFDGRILSEPSPAGRVRGIVRRGDRIAAFDTVQGTGCPGGSWIRVAGGFVCTTDGFTPSRSGESAHYQKAPDMYSPLPFDYAMVRNQRAPRMSRVPTAAEEAELRAFQNDPTAKRPEALSLSLVGDVFVAVDDLEQGEAGSYWRTVWGHYVREEDVELQPMPVMSGEILGHRADGSQGLKLPLAFVFGEDRPLYQVEGESIEPIGTAAKYARFEVVEEVEIDGKAYVVDDEGRALERDAVRVARVSDAPSDVPAGRQWIHVDLDQQTLVAYEGRRPVFATLIASGKPGYDTPAGLFRVQNKHLSITMSGDDPKDGHYEVEEVPWTMFYYEGFALHGAYWHDDFGKVRSHGCTNIAPIDARWLYYWTSPKVPEGWYAVRSRLGTYVSFTRAKQES